ncbi:MAG: DUF2974 domain-containing protein [Lachnospiraceae bacterium]|nr:DUF2974 domain-containing protein [Lachnospiraceae bacterium]
MANFFDYLEWRGDLTFEEAEFNEIDSLILCWLSYVALDGIVPGECSEYASLTIEETAKRFFMTHDLDRIMNSTVSFTKTSILLLQKLAQTNRFSGVRLTGFVNRIDYDRESQFCAMTVLVKRGLTYVVYRGTDDTLIGWKEDFNMSFLPVVPAQSMALNYLEYVANRIPGKLFVGGHSKGGNLAIYAAVRASFRIRRRILRVYNNDGPGFYDLKSLGDAYEEMVPKIKNYLPESSVIGVLLEHAGEFTVIRSNSKGFLQHDALSWEVLGPHFIELETLSSSSLLFTQVIQNWLREVSKEEREVFVDTLFGILDATNARSIDDLNAEKAKVANMALKEIGGLDKGTKSMLAKTLAALFKEGNSVIKSSLSAVSVMKKK